MARRLANTPRRHVRARFARVGVGRVRAYRVDPRKAPYSDRNAISGLTRVARNAGSPLATRATIINTTGLPVYRSMGYLEVEQPMMRLGL